MQLERALLLWTTASIALGWLPRAGSAQETIAPLRLGAVYQSLAEQSPRIQAAEAAAQAAEARIATARRPPDPQLQFGLMNRELPNFGPMEVLGMTQLQVMQMIPFPGKLGLAGRVAEAQAGASRARAAEVSWEQRTRVAMAFYDLFQTDHSLLVATATQSLLRNLARTTETMYAVGEGRQADVLRAQVEIARMTEEITRMQAMRTSMAARLNALLNRPQDEPVSRPVLPIFPDDLPSLDSLEALAIALRPMIKAGEREVRAAEAAERLARREIWPDFQVGVQYGQRGMESGTDRMVSLMLGFNLPIFAGSRQLKMRREAEAMRLMATADLASMRAETRGRLGELVAELQRARALSTLYRSTVLPQAKKTVAASLSAYQVGGVNFMTLLDNQMAVNRYRQELFLLMAEQGKAFAEIEMLLGRELLDPNTVADLSEAGGHE